MLIYTCNFLEYFFNYYRWFLFLLIRSRVKVTTLFDGVDSESLETHSGGIH